MRTKLKVNLSEIKVQDVSTNCVLLVSKFGRALFSKYGIRLKLQEPRVLNKAAAYAAATKDEALSKIYALIEVEIIKHVKKTQNKKIDTVVLHISDESSFRSPNSTHKG